RDADRGERGRGEVQGDGAVLTGGGDQDAAAGGEPHRAPVGAGAVQDVRGGQRRVAAQGDLGGGGEPAQRPVGLAAVGERVGEGRLGVVDLQGDVLHPVVVRERVEEQHSGGVAGEGPVGE